MPLKSVAICYQDTSNLSFLRAYPVVPQATKRPGVRVRKYGAIAALIVVFCSLSAWAGTTFKATTTLAVETSNNTSAADSFATQTDGNIGATNISKAPTRNLLYAGSTA